MDIQFVDIGFSNFVETYKIFSINRPDGAPTKRLVQHAKDTNMFIDLTAGKKTRSIITMSGECGIVIVASAITTLTVVERIRRVQQANLVVESATKEITKTTILN